MPTVPRNLSVSQFLVQTNPDDVPPSKVIVSDFDAPRHVLTYGELQSKPIAARLRVWCHNQHFNNTMPKPDSVTNKERLF